MKAIGKSLFLFGVLNLSLAKAQPYSLPFPSDEYILLAQIQLNDDWVVFQMELDSLSENHSGLLFRNTRKYKNCLPGIAPYIYPPDYRFSLHNYSFLDSSGIHSVHAKGQLLAQVRTNLSQGDTFSFNKHPQIYLHSILYEFQGIEDSAMVFYPYENGQANLSRKPMVFGKTRGWLEGGEYLKFRQVGSIDQQGNYTGIRRPVWKDFYPERSGDLKVFRKGSSLYNWNPDFIGHLDTFITVNEYADSIRQTIRRRQLTRGWTYEPPVDFSLTVTGKSDRLKASLSNPYFACPVYPATDSTWSWDEGTVNHSEFTYSPQKDKWSIVSFFLGLGIQDSCLFPVVADADNAMYFSEEFGYMGYELSGYSYYSDRCVAAKVGNRQFGNLALSLNDQSSESLNLYPNPAHSLLNLKDDFSGSAFEITDLAGATQMKGIFSENTVSLEGLSDGVYILRILQKDGSAVSGKFVKTGP